MSKWVPKEIHIFMAREPGEFGGRLCGKSTRSWPEEYMRESAGLYQKLPMCKECLAELKKHRAKLALSNRPIMQRAKPPKLVLWDYRTD